MSVILNLSSWKHNPGDKVALTLWVQETDMCKLYDRFFICLSESGGTPDMDIKKILMMSFLHSVSTCSNGEILLPVNMKKHTNGRPGDSQAVTTGKSKCSLPS